MTLSPRTKLVLLAALFLLPMAASFFAYYVIKPPATANYGELLPPRPAPAFEALRGSWVLVVSDAGACPESCRAKLDTVSRVRLALGRKASRVQRAFVPDDGAPADAALAAAGIRIVPKPTQGTEAADRGHIYLIDPRGNAMMRWPAEPQAKRMLKDLERLLKASQIG